MPDTPLVPDAGSPFLWQARIQQFVEHLADAGAAGTEIAAEFRTLPPAGLLPVDALDLGARRDRFFPSSYSVEAAPVPAEQLDAAIEASASLMAYDTTVPDQVRVLVPVPQRWYEPRLLMQEVVDAEFQTAIDAFVARRTGELRRRESLRRKIGGLSRAVTGTAPAYPTPEADPDRLEDEGPFTTLPFDFTAAHRSSLAAGPHQHRFAGATATLTVGAGDLLYTYVQLDPDNPPGELMLQWHDQTWEHRAYWGANLLEEGLDGTESRRSLGALPPAGRWVRLDIPAALVGLEGQAIDGIAFSLYDGRAAWGPAGTATPGAPPAEVVWFTDTLPADAVPDGTVDGWQWLAGDDLLAPFEESYQTVASADGRVAEPLATLRADLAGRNVLAAEELAELDRRGVEPFIGYLEDKLKRADDTIDFGFLRVQTDVYRIRQLMLGATDATRLATSPALAEIARGETANATQEQISAFLGRLRGGAAVRDGAPGADATPRGGLAAGMMSPTTFAGAFATGDRFSATMPGKITTSFGDAAGLQANLFAAASGQSISQLVDAEAVSDKGLFGAARATTGDIVGQSAIVGEALNFRTTTVAERLKQPESSEAKSFTVAGRHDVVAGLANLGLKLDDIEVPGLVTTEQGATTKVTFAQLQDSATRAGILGKILGNVYDPVPANADEAAFFGAGVKALDDTVATLRLVEGRVQAYRNVIARCRAALDELRGLLAAANQRLQALGDELAEARHDVAVARALLAEEQARIATINERRARIIAEQVPFLAFHRPRVADTLLATPVRSLDPGLTVAPVPACLARAVAIPDELRALIDLLRDAPLRWFVQLPPLLDRFDRLETLQETVRAASLRAQLAAQVTAPARLAQKSRQLPAASGLGQSIAQVYSAQRQVVAQYRAQTARVDVGRFALQSWQATRDQVAGLVALGDLIDAGHGRSDVTQQVSHELDMIARVAGCLYALFGEVLPALRLDWAERLSQYDAPVNLRSLASLPRWGEIEFVDRRELQSLVDWLYQRVDPRQPEAVAMIGDLVRVCLLLASHAPVNRIIAGTVTRTATVTEGGRVDLTAIDHARVRIGMQVAIYAGEAVVARGVVEDLSAGQAAARVVQVFAGEPAARSVQLTAGARVRFAEPASATLFGAAMAAPATGMRGR